MNSLRDFTLNHEYKRVKELGDKLSEFDSQINWKPFRAILKGMYFNGSERGGRPNIDVVIMIKMLLLQSTYGLSDPELERQATDRISFRKFLGFPKKIPDHSTVWSFREMLKGTGKDKEVWDELQRQLDSKGLEIKKGTIQDATFITADPGHAKADKPRGDESKTRRSKDGTWVKKGNKNYFGYKLHTKIDMAHGLIREISTTVSSLHDSQVDLSEEGEVIYRDRGYFGASCKGYDATMKRSVRGHPIDIRDKLRNERISRKRSPGERPYAVIKNVFKSGHTHVTTLARVSVKNMFVSFAYNLFQLRTLKRQGVI